MPGTIRSAPSNRCDEHQQPDDSCPQSNASPQRGQRAGAASASTGFDGHMTIRTGKNER
jgi:hypothetical protein